MSTSVLQSIMDNWGVGAPVADAKVQQCCQAVSTTWADASKVDQDVERLKDLMRRYPIRPHLNEGGGSGFSYCRVSEWGADKGEIAREFSRLWFSAAGDRIIAEYGHLMRVIPQADYASPVQFRPWLSEAETGPGGNHEAHPEACPPAK